MSKCESCAKCGYACDEFAVCEGRLVKPREECEEYRKKAEK